MRVSDFDFTLPDDLIAQDPPVERGTSRLLHLDRASGARQHRHVSDLPDILRPGDLLVANDTRVFPARLLGHRVPSGGAVECLLVRRLREDAGGAEVWEALMHPGQKLKPGARVRFDGDVAIHGEVLERLFYGRRTIRLWRDDGGALMHAIEAIGHMPLPPYIKRDDRPADRNRYQTLFARERGSIAAPTAGLHFTDDIVRRLIDCGIEIARITLHVGYGTFQPVRVENVEEHRLESEPFEVTDDTAAAVNRALDERRRIIAVGTTTTRTLESVGRANGGRLIAGRGETSLFIYPGFEFTIISGLLTNFHLPQSSLLMLVAAFAGRDPVLAAYRDAVARGYRFYSYGDAMVIT